MPAAAGFRMFTADDGNDLDSTLAKLLSHLDRHRIATAGRRHERRVLGRQIEIPQNAFRQSADVLQKHRLPLAVGTHHEIVKAQRQLDDGVESGEGTVARPHFLDQNPAVARAEQMHHAPG